MIFMLQAPRFSYTCRTPILATAASPAIRIGHKAIDVLAPPGFQVNAAPSGNVTKRHIAEPHSKTAYSEDHKPRSQSP
jgi:hypothetical protein